MKHTLTLLVLLFIPFVCFGQGFDFNDLKVINSEKQFKRFCFENEFVKTEKSVSYITYAQGYTKEASEEKASVWTYYYLVAGIFEFQFVKNYDGTSNYSFNRVLQQVKKQCTFYDFKEYGLGEIKEFICYTCPGSAYPGKIGFARTEENDFIELFTNFN